LKNKIIGKETEPDKNTIKDNLWMIKLKDPKVSAIGVNNKFRLLSDKKTLTLKQEKRIKRISTYIICGK
jgi:hypothetical protein